MSLMTERRSENVPVGTPSPDRVNAPVDVTPTHSNIPMSLQKDMRRESYSTTNTFSTHSSSASKVLSSSKYTSESFQKTFSEFGQIISQRRAELSEMKRANQFRMSSQLRHNMSPPDYTQSTPTPSEALENANHLTGDATPTTTPATHSQHNHSATHTPGSSRLLARKLILSQQKHSDSPSVTSEMREESEEASSNLLNDISAEHRKPHAQGEGQGSGSVFEEMTEKLHGEKARTAELALKIEELHSLEEAQREKALALAQERDKLEAVRADLLERNASLELDHRQQQQVLNSRQERISELEKEQENGRAATQQWKEKFAVAESDRDQVRKELAAFRSQMAAKDGSFQAASEEREKEHKSALREAQKTIAARDGVIDAKQKEFTEMSDDNEALRKSMSAMEQQHATAIRNKEAAEKQNECVTRELKSLEQQFREMEEANKAHIVASREHTQQMQEAHDRVSALSKRLEEVTTQCSTLTRTNEEVEEKCIVMKRSLSGKEESCEALQQKVAVLLKADKVHSTSHRTKVIILLLAIWILLMAVIFEHILDFQPRTVSPYRITS